MATRQPRSDEFVAKFTEAHAFIWLNCASHFQASLLSKSLILKPTCF